MFKDDKRSTGRRTVDACSVSMALLSAVAVTSRPSGVCVCVCDVIVFFLQSHKTSTIHRYRHHHHHLQQQQQQQHLQFTKHCPAAVFTCCAR